MRRPVPRWRRRGGRPRGEPTALAPGGEKCKKGPERSKGHVMPTFVLLSTLTAEGVQTLKNNPQRLREVNKEIEQLGATVTAQWAVLGRFDFVNIVEAPDETTMARVSLE